MTGGRPNEKNVRESSGGGDDPRKGRFRKRIGVGVAYEALRKI
jgi:hypothetical protein